EMKRLAGDQKISRAELAGKFTSEFPITLLLKGSRTVVAESGKRISYNATGNPGMATGGMGDVLTGVCAALLAQNLSPFDAARADRHYRHRHPKIHRQDQIRPADSAQDWWFDGVNGRRLRQYLGLEMGGRFRSVVAVARMRTFACREEIRPARERTNVHSLHG